MDTIKTITLKHDTSPIIYHKHLIDMYIALLAEYACFEQNTTLEKKSIPYFISARGKYYMFEHNIEKFNAELKNDGYVEENEDSIILTDKLISEIFI